jgi:membrane protein YqaA with SNARE-associated domain
VFSVLGGLGGYAIGWGMFEAIEPWLRESHYWDAYLTARQWFDDYGVWVVFVAGFSPIPFFLGSLIGRSARFFLVAGLVRLGGERFESSLSKHIERIGWAVVAISAVVIAWLMMRG